MEARKKRDPCYICGNQEPIQHYCIKGGYTICDGTQCSDEFRRILNARYRLGEKRFRFSARTPRQ